MRKNSFYLVLIVVLAAFAASCSKNKYREGSISEKAILKPQMEVSQSDTTEVLSMVNHLLELLQAKEFDDAVNMLYYLKKDSIVPLTPSQKRMQRNVFITHQGVSYDINKLIFHTEVDSEVQYYVTLFEKKPGDPRPNRVGFMVKPVRRDGKWYLTMADSPTNTAVSNNRGTEIEN